MWQYITNTQGLVLKCLPIPSPLGGGNLSFTFPSMLFLAESHLPHLCGEANILGHVLYNLPYMKSLSKGVALCLLSAPHGSQGERFTIYFLW